MKKIESDSYKITKLAQPQGLTNADPGTVDMGELAESTTFSLQNISEDMAPNILQNVNQKIQEMLKNLAENQIEEVDEFIDQNGELFNNTEEVLNNLENNIRALTQTIEPTAAEEARLPEILVTVNYIDNVMDQIRSNMEALKNKMEDVGEQAEGTSQVSYEQIQ